MLDNFNLDARAAPQDLEDSQNGGSAPFVPVGDLDRRSFRYGARGKYFKRFGPFGPKRRPLVQEFRAVRHVQRRKKQSWDLVRFKHAQHVDIICAFSAMLISGSKSLFSILRL